MDCYNCRHCEIVPDKGHELSSFSTRYGFDGFCWKHYSFLVEVYYCEDYVPLERGE